MRNEKGFLVLEVLIASLILTASVAATMYLFRIGAEGLERANHSNLISSRLPQAVNLIKSLDMNIREGSEDLGEGIIMTWKSRLLEKAIPDISTQEGNVKGIHELYLYQVDFELAGREGLKREYKLNVFSYKTLSSQAQEF